MSTPVIIARWDGGMVSILANIYIVLLTYLRGTK
jgi:hypothetical protein